MDSPSPVTPLGQVLDEVIRLARSAEKLTATATTLMPTARALGELRDYDSELEPEIAVAFEHVQGALASLTRAGTFLEARFDASIERLRVSLDQEGDPS